VLANSNPPVHQVGQGVIHDSLQTLLFDPSDMHLLLDRRVCGSETKSLARTSVARRRASAVG
jgi:hypothetical protein